MGHEDETNDGNVIYVEDDEIASPSTLHLPGAAKPFPTFQKAIRRWQVLRREDRVCAWIVIDKSQRRFHPWEMAWITVKSMNKPLLPKDEGDDNSAE